MKTAIQIVLGLFVVAAAAILFNAAALGETAALRAGDEAQKIRDFITPRKIRIIAGFYMAAAAAAAILIQIFYVRTASLTAQFCKNLSCGIRTKYLELSKSQKVIIAGVIVLHVGLSISCALAIPVTNDEAFTYINYVHRGIAAAVTLYNEPNNHVFYSVLANIFNVIPALDSGFKIRLPAIIGGLFTLPAFYLLAEKLNNRKSAVFALILFSGFYLTAKYHFLARGYGLMMLFFILSLYAAHQLRKTPQNKSALLLFVLSAVFGFYTHPAFLIPFAVCLGHLLLNNFTAPSRMTAFYLSGFTLTGTVLLYFPLIVLNGFTAFISNSGLEKPDLPTLFAQITTNITGVFTQSLYDQGMAITIAFALFISGLYISRRRVTVYTFLLSIFMIFIILLVTGSPMFIRNLLWINVLFAVISASSLGWIAERFLTKRITLLFVSSFFIIVFSVRALLLPQTFRIYYHRLFQAYDFAHHVPQNFGVLYSEHTSDYYTILRYEAMIKQEKTGQLVRENFNAETAYDRVLNIKKRGDTFHLKSQHNYEQEYEDDYISLWRRVK